MGYGLPACQLSTHKEDRTPSLNHHQPQLPIQLQLPILNHHRLQLHTLNHHLLLPPILLLHQFRTITLTLARLTLEAMESIRTLTATRLRKFSLSTSVSPTLRRRATPRTRRSPTSRCTRTAQGSSRPMSSVSASMLMSWFVT